MNPKLRIAVGIVLFIASLWGSAFVLGHYSDDSWLIFPTLMTGVAAAMGGIYLAVDGFTDPHI